MSLRHIYVQIINDEEGHTLVSASTLDPSLKDSATGCNIETAKKVGELVAKRALDKGITKVTFDRGGYLYHGRIKALAEAAREGGVRILERRRIGCKRETLKIKSLLKRLFQ